MKANTVRCLKVAILTAAVVAYSWVLYYFYCSPDSPRNIEARNREMAAQHIPVVRKALEKAAQFTRLQLIPYTGEGGCLGVFGELDSHAAFDDLKKTVAATTPPVHVHWGVRVVPPEG